MVKRFVFSLILIPQLPQREGGVSFYAAKIQQHFGLTKDFLIFFNIFLKIQREEAYGWPPPAFRKVISSILTLSYFWVKITMRFQSLVP